MVDSSVPSGSPLPDSAAGGSQTLTPSGVPRPVTPGSDTALTLALDHLAAVLEGELARPGDDGYDGARQAWNLAVDQHPTAVVTAASAQDVVVTVAAARHAGLRVAAEATGHNVGCRADMGSTILVKFPRMRAVSIDRLARTARVEAGAQWADVVNAAHPHGLAALAGSSHDVGVVGYCLGGGVSWLARSHGLAANSVTAVELVTADGVLRRVDETHDSDLFWALRGGGGSFGVVTAMELALYPITEVHAGTLFFPIARAAEVLTAWQEWTQSLPASVMSVGRLLRFPTMPDLPPFLSGQSYVVVEAALQHPADEADALLEPLRRLEPVIDTFEDVAVPGLLMLHMDPPTPVPGRGDGTLLGPLSPSALEALLAACGPDVDSPLLSVELRHLGGMLRPGQMKGGVVSGLAADYALFTVGIAPFPEVAAAVEAAVDAVLAAVAPWTTGGAYLNFAERPRTGDQLFGDDHQRLREVKRTWDPEDVFSSNHPVAPA